jgi:molybdopterin/thiamine biosynthesis adenylyltransferase
MNNIFIIGCGGVGSWLTPSLCLLAGAKNITICDGDKLEHKNLNRQLFTEDDIGRNKAEALAEKYGCRAHPDWFHTGSFEIGSLDVLLVCVDNNPARRSALRATDMFNCMTIIGANETYSAEAYLYLPAWRDTRLDPRKYYDLSSDTGDPMAASIGCTGKAQEETPQLVSANFMAAALMQHLFVLWAMEARKFDLNSGKLFQNLPYKLNANLTRLENHLIGPEPVAKIENKEK